MSEHGFYHPDRGYWQTIGKPSDEIKEAYPDGTVEVPLRPTDGVYKWEDGAWARQPDPEPSTDPVDYPLNPAQFEALVTYLGKDAEIRTAIGQISDPMQRAWALSRYENATTYLYDDVMLQQIRQDIGMSEADLTAAWMQAKDLSSSSDPLPPGG